MMKLTYWIGILSLLGGIAGLGLVFTFFQTGWGEPGTAEYQTYELLNRLNALVILFMAAGWLAAFFLLEGYGRWAALVAIVLLLALPLDLFSIIGFGSTSLVATLYGLVIGWILITNGRVFSVQSS